MNDLALVNLIFEAFHLKMVQHEGERILNIEPISVASHSLNAAQIGYILAKMENADAEKVATMMIWHDLPETRIGDLHWIAQKYIDDKKTIEDQVFADQMQDVFCGVTLQRLFDEYQKNKTQESKIAHDADVLEQVFQMRMYQEQWLPPAKVFLKHFWPKLQTESAKKLFGMVRRRSFWQWALGAYLSKERKWLQWVVDLIFECIHLKRIYHEGWKLAWVKDPDTVAEHSLLAAQIAYLVAQNEWGNANKIASMLVRHDLAETRIGDQHKVAARYLTNKKSAEKKVMKDQLSGLDFGEDIHKLLDIYENKIWLDGQIAKEADYLEQAFQGKIYVELGYSTAQVRINNVGKKLQNPSTQTIWETMTKTKFGDWRNQKNLMKIEK